MKHLMVIIFSFIFTFASASTFTFSKINEEALNADKSTIFRIDSLEYEGTYPLYKINYLRARAYLSQSMFTEALEHIKLSLGSKEISSDTVVHKQAYMLLSELAVFTCSLLDASKFIVDGKKYAEKINDRYLEASIMLSEGIIYRRLGFVNRSVNNIFGGIRILEKGDDVNSVYGLSHAYGLLMLSYMHDGDFKAAWHIGHKRKLVLDLLREKDKGGYLYDNQAGYYYSKMAYLNYLMGDKDKAKECFSLFDQTVFSSTFRGWQEINDYLLAIGEYSGVVSNIESYFNDMDSRDTLNIFYFRSLQQAGIAYEALGEYEKALALTKKWAQLQERMRVDYERNFLFETADLFNALDNKEALDQKDTRIRYGNYFAVLLTLLSLVLFVRVVWNRVLIIRSNKKMTNLILENEDQKIQLDESIMTSMMNRNEKLLSGAKNAQKNGGGGSVMSDKEIFASFNSCVKAKKLFLDYQLGRDDYARIMKVDKNRFASILKEQSGMNLANYLNSLRLEYSVNLFRKNPELSVNEVAEKSGIPSVSTFYRLFKERYGMNPSVFREQIGSSDKK